MKFFDRLAFKTAQKKLRDNINSNSAFKNENLVNPFTKEIKGKGGGLGGFVLGSLLGPIGVLIAYLINDDHKKNRVKWAWIGLIAFIPMSVLLFFVLAAIFGYGGS
jgi:hypothetical protein